jgi:Na+/H+ antiporter NhaD/arsenite permease-like protein
LGVPLSKSEAERALTANQPKWPHNEAAMSCHTASPRHGLGPSETARRASVAGDRHSRGRPFSQATQRFAEVQIHCTRALGIPRGRAHLVPFFILVVANAGGLLTPLGDPPLLVGYIQGVPFFWTLHLLPIWLLYVGIFLAAFYVVDRRAHARETRPALAANRADIEPLSLDGTRNLAFLLAIVPAALLPEGYRELALLAIALTSYFTTPKSVHTANSFSFGPISEVALIFVGLFLCLGPVEVTLAEAAPHLPVQSAWQLFWGSGVLSSMLDNAPTYTAFTALARGLPSHSAALVAGIDPIKLAAISAGSVVMGATTYIGNGPNLMVKVVAESERYAMPSFFRYFVFAFSTMLPAHLIVTAGLWWLDR